jgi:amino acid transporter
MCYAVMISLGEMVSAMPLPGGAITLAGKYVDSSLSFTVGWFYWYTWTIFLPSELSALSVLINLWNDTISNAAWISIFLVAAVTLNMLGSAWFGEVEFWLSYLKIFLVVGLLITSIVISAGGGPNKETIGFRFWRDPGPFVQYAGIAGTLGRFLGFWATLTRAAFAYIGSEIVAIAAGETRNPRRNVPRAIKNVYIRILLFYIGGVFAIGITVPSNDPRLALNAGSALASPFVIAIETAGIKVLPSVVNAGLIASGWSAANSELFTSSRALHGLAIRGHAPHFFGKTTKNGVPYIAILTCAVFATLAFMSLGSSAGVAFGYLASLGAAGGLLMWWSTCVTYIRFERGLRVQGIPRDTLPYASWFNGRAGAAWYAACLIAVVLFFSGWSVFLKGNWDSGIFCTTYLPIIIFPIVYGAHKLYSKSKLVPYEQMVYCEAGREFDDEPVAEKSKWRRVVAAVV